MCWYNDGIYLHFISGNLNHPVRHCTLSPAVASCNRKSSNNHSFVQLLYDYAPGSCIPNLWRTDVKGAQGLGKQGRGESSWNTQLKPNTYLWVSSTHKLDFSNLAKLRQACRHTSWARTGQPDWARISRGLGLHSTLFTQNFVLCFHYYCSCLAE